MRTLALTLAALGLLAAGPVLAQDHSGHSGHAAGMPTDKTSAAYMAAMTRMDEAMKAAPMAGKPGIDFARMMIPHHQSAIDMAKAYLASGETDPTITRIAEDVVASQEREITELRAWLKTQGAE